MSGVNLEKPCYYSPGPGQVTKMAALTSELDKLAENGVGIAGTFIPKRVGGNACVGFMECGVESAGHAVDRITAKGREQEEAAPMLTTTKFRDQLQNQRAASTAVTR